MKRIGMVMLGVAIIWMSVAIAAAQQTTPSPKVFTLQQALMAAQNNSPALQSEMQGVAMARANLGEAALRRNPTLDLAGESYPLFESKKGSFFNNQELSLRVGQPLEFGGKRRKRKLVAEQMLVVASHDLKNFQRQLRYEVEVRYATVALADAQRHLAEEMLRQFDEMIRINEARLQQGEISGLELSRVKAERQRYDADAIDARKQTLTSRIDLLELLGVDDGDLSFAVEPIVTSEFTQDLPRLLATAATSRSDLLAAEGRAELGRRAVNLERANALPDVTPTFGYKRDAGRNTVVIGVSLPLQLFNRNQYGVLRSRAEAEQRQADARRMSIAVSAEIRRTMLVCDASAERLKQLQVEYAPAAAKARDSARQSYRLGAIDLLNLLDAERVYRETVRSLHAAQFEKAAADFALQAAVGEEL